MRVGAKVGVARQIGEILDHWCPEPQPSLYYLNTFTLLIATLLSAHTTDAMVNQATPALFALAQNPEAMFHLGEAVIYEKIRRCGLATKKARFIAQLSHILLYQYNGETPSDLGDLLLLPGVGRKTALVVRVQGFGIPEFPVDTHVFRSARRWGLSDSTSVVGVEKDLCALFPYSLWGKRHLQCILFARRFCPAKKHDQRRCPICGVLGLLRRVECNDLNQER